MQTIAGTRCIQGGAALINGCGKQKLMKKMKLASYVLNLTVLMQKAGFPVI
jgi:hypothetical protein